MELWTKLGWLALVAIHASPAAVAVVPGMAQRLYGGAASGNLGILLTHRGVLFLAVLAAAALAIFDDAGRRTASVVAAISMIGFLQLYARAGMPAGPLRTIAWVDLVGLVPLIFVSLAAWRQPAS